MQVFNEFCLKRKPGPLVHLVLNGLKATKCYRFTTDYIHLWSVVGMKTFSLIKTEENLIIQSTVRTVLLVGLTCGPGNLGRIFAESWQPCKSSCI